MTFQNTIALLSIMVVIYTMYKTAEENRISKIHEEMYLCLVEIVSIFNKTLSLLDDIANKVYYQEVPESSLGETAYDRYWRDIGEFSRRFKLIQDRQRLCVPKTLCKDIQNIVKKLNSARAVARSVAPDGKRMYPDTSDLKKIVKETKKDLQNFISQAREYLGTNRMKPLLGSNQVSLAGKDIERDETAV